MSFSDSCVRSRFALFPCDRDRPKEVKCPRIVTETYRDDAGETRVRTYVRGRPLGKGGFAVVYSMQDPSTGESFAVGPGGYCSTRHPTHFEPSYLELNGTL